MNRRLYLATYGCQMNEPDSEELRGMLTAQGYVETPYRVPRGWVERFLPRGRNLHEVPGTVQELACESNSARSQVLLLEPDTSYKGSTSRMTGKLGWFGW